jgi:TrmH family RNA methyltransferase
MLSWKDNISFILVEPREPGNVGASARALKNMGFNNLELVNPGNFLTEEARQMACNAADILEKAKIYSKFKDALKDKNLIIGTTRRLGRQRGLLTPLKESIKRIIISAKRNNVAILFGRERNGLNNHEVEKCDFLVTIPADPSFPSLNLAQSVLIAAYELCRKTYKTELPLFVNHDEREKLYEHIRNTLKLLEYVPRGDRDIDAKIMKNIKQIVGRAGLTEWELGMLHGICTQVERRLKES